MTLVFGFLLIYLSLNIFERKRVAWWLVVMASALLVVAHILSGRLWYLAIASAIAFVLLLILRKRFTVRSEISSIRRGATLMAVSLLVPTAKKIVSITLIVLGVIGLTLADPHLRHAG